MKKLLLTTAIFCSALLSGSFTAFGWGEKGHNAIAHIAQKHLTGRAQRQITKLLNGHDMAYWSSWADGLRDDDRYAYLYTWHFANADEGYTYASSPKNPDGDVLTAVNFCVEQLQTKGQSDSLRSYYLKLLIHFVGDMHCPMHAGRLSDRGGNQYAVTFRNLDTNLHRLWDSQIIDAAHPWSAFEWALNVDRRMSRAERKRLGHGTPLDWMEQTVVLAGEIYAGTPTDENLSWDYINVWSPVVSERFLVGGYRLAALLNDIFGC